MKSSSYILLLVRWDLILGQCLDAQIDTLAYTCITNKLPQLYEAGEQKHCICKNNCVPFKLTCIRNATDKYWNFPSDISCESNNFTNIKLEEIDPYLILTHSNGAYNFECENGYELNNTNDNITCSDGNLRHDPVLCKLRGEEVNISNYVLLGIGLMVATLLSIICICLRYHGRSQAKTLQSRFNSFSYSTRSTQDELNNMTEPSPSLSRRNFSRENSRIDLKNNKMFTI